MTKVYGKIDDDNTDLEIEEAEFLWEIERDWTKKYFRRSYVVLKKMHQIK